MLTRVGQRISYSLEASVYTRGYVASAMNEVLYAAAVLCMYSVGENPALSCSRWRSCALRVCVDVWCTQYQTKVYIDTYCNE